MMKDLIGKLTELEATAPKAPAGKKMLTEDSVSPAQLKEKTLKDIFNELSEGLAPGQKPLPVLDPQKKQAGMGFVTSNNPAVQNILKNLDPKDVQIVQAPGQPGQPQPAGQQANTAQPAQAGVTSQPQQGQMQMKEVGASGQKYEVMFANGKTQRFVAATPEEAKKKAKGLGATSLIKITKDGMSKGKVEERDEGKPGKNFAKIAKSAGKRYGSKEAGERVAGAVRAKLAAQGKLEEEAEAEKNAKDTKKTFPNVKHFTKSGNPDWKKHGFKDMPVKEEELDEKFASQQQAKLMYATAGGADTGVSKKVAKEFIKKSHGQKVGKLPKKVKEADIPSTQGVDTMGAGLGRGRSATTLEGKKPDFLDLDKDGNKKESMKKAAADKNKKKVDESMNHRISAARLEGKSHGLRGHAHCGKSYDDLEERKAYCEGYKDGLDECYGMGVYEAAPAAVGGPAKAAPGTPPATVGGMAKAAMEDEFDEGNAFTGALARTKKGGKFSVGGKTFTDNSSLEEAESGFQLFIPSYSGPDKGMDFGDDTLLNQHVIAGDIKRVYSSDPKKKYGMTYAATNPKGEEILKSLLKKGIGQGPGIMSKIKSAVGLGETDFAFEAWDRELNNLLNEGTEVNEGLSVSVSKGQQNSPDSVTITAQDAEADQLLQLVKHAGLGLFGDEAAHEPSSAMSIQPSHGEPDEVGAGGVDVEVVDGHDGIMGLMQKLSGIQSSDHSHDDEDYADEEGHEEKHTCNECGMMEAECKCNEEQIEEVESEDQMGAEVAENAPDSGAEDSIADEEAEAKEDADLAGADSEDEEEMNESFFEMLQRLDSLLEGSGDKPKHPAHDKKDDKDYDDAEEDAEEELDEGKWNYPKHMTKNVTTSDMDTTNAARNREERKAFRKKEKAKAHAALMKGEPKKEKDEEELNEWANQVGKGPGKGTDASFEQDIEFMTKVIAGGLNKPKSTGQTTVPVIAGQVDRMVDSPKDWATLAGIKKA